jgi:hypothetical protein
VERLSVGRQGAEEDVIGFGARPGKPMPDPLADLKVFIIFPPSSARREREGRREYGIAVENHAGQISCTCFRRAKSRTRPRIQGFVISRF